MRKLFKIAVVNSHPIQYFAPLYAYINKNSEIDVTAIYCSDFSVRGGEDSEFKRKIQWDIDLLNGYKSVFIGTDSQKIKVPKGFFSLISWPMWREVKNGDYDAIWLHGYSYVAFIIAFFAAKASGKKVMFRSETHLGLQRSRARKFMRDFLLKFAFRFVDSFLAIGQRNRDYYISLGVPTENIFLVPYAVDNDRFVSAAKQAHCDRDALRMAFGLPLDRPVVLFASKFMKRKHPEDLLAAVVKLNEIGISLTLLFVGSGEMENELKERVAELRMSNVVFSGFVNQAELPNVYAISDVFVLPSENEPWGLIVNEVMCSGLPIIISDEVGCVPDLVKDGINGAHFKAGDVNSLVEKLKKILASRGSRDSMGAASLEIIQNWDYAHCLHGIRAALMYAVKRT